MTPLLVRGACPHDCPDTCAMLVTVENGRAIRVAGDPDHPVTNGFLCAKVNRYIERTYHHDRLSSPMRRVGPKGSGQFEPISWTVALDEIATELDPFDPHAAEAASLAMPPVVPEDTRPLTFGRVALGAGHLRFRGGQVQRR